MEVKNQLGKENFYLSIIRHLEASTNLTKIQKKLSISKQLLNYYLRELKKRGLVIKKGRGWYELVKKSKNSTKYGNLLVKDSSRGHAYVWNVKIPKKIEGWDKRIKILKDKNINFILVGALKTTPRIKVLGRKVWLCNNHIRIFDKQKQSYYGKTAKESKQLSHLELFNIVKVLENKLGFLFKPLNYTIQKEHYALIKNDLAIDQNKKGIIMRISDKEREWLLIDDSLEEGGELETVGKKAYKTNIPLQSWWNDNKKHKFEVTPSFILKTMNGIQQNQVMFDKNFQSHLKVINKLGNAVDELREEIKSKKE